MLIGVTGSKGSGKDTFANYFKSFGFVDVKQAGPLKAMLSTMYREAGLQDDDIVRRLEGDLKEIPCTILGGATPRHAMQTLGTDWREMIDRHLWLRIWQANVSALLKQGKPVICTDIRFKHEAEALDNFGGTLVRIERGVNTDFHVSETEMRELYARHTIMNDGTIEDLEVEASRLLNELMGAAA